MLVNTLSELTIEPFSSDDHAQAQGDQVGGHATRQEIAGLAEWRAQAPLGEMCVITEAGVSAVSTRQPRP